MTLRGIEGICNKNLFFVGIFNTLDEARKIWNDRQLVIIGIKNTPRRIY